MGLQQEKIYTIEDIFALPDGQRAELLDGQLYMMAPPSRIHQKISHVLEWTIENYIRDKNGLCEVYTAPFAVFLYGNDTNYVEPDISVICDKDKLNDKGCNGAPDWIIEVVSPSNQQMDYGIKLFKYRTAGVREYWIVNPMMRTVNVYDFESGENTCQYGFDDSIPVCIYGDFHIKISDLLHE